MAFHLADRHTNPVIKIWRISVIHLDLYDNKTGASEEKKQAREKEEGNVERKGSKEGEEEGKRNGRGGEEEMRGAEGKGGKKRTRMREGEREGGRERGNTQARTVRGPEGD